MGMERIKTNGFRPAIPGLPAIVLPPRKPEPTPAPEATTSGWAPRARYKAARASLPARIRSRPVAGLIVRALLDAGVTWSDIVSRRKFKRYAATRQKIAWLVYETTGWSSQGVADVLQIEDHTTVIHARRKIEGLIREGATVDRGIAFLRPRDVAKVAAIKATRIQAMAAQDAVIAARLAAENAARVAAAKARCAAAIARIAEHVGSENVGIAVEVACEARISAWRLLGGTKDRKVRAARDRILFLMRARGCSVAAMSEAFSLRKCFVTAAANRAAVANQGAAR